MNDGSPLQCKKSMMEVGNTNGRHSENFLLFQLVVFSDGFRLREFLTMAVGKSISSTERFRARAAWAPLLPQAGAEKASQKRIPAEGDGP
jgi:hypothetical protein